jgi:type IV fimbrial biogenesis protein FimT
VLKRRAQRGVTLIEVAIGLAIIGVLLSLALPNFATFLRNTEIKNAAETTLSGINLARAEAVRRNASVRFQLVNSLTSSCALSSSSLNWVVSLDDPAGKCNVAPSDSTAPRAIQAKSGQEGTKNITVSTTGGSTVIFNGLGRVSGSGITQIDFSNPLGGACEHVDSTSSMRCLRVLLTTGGQAKLCDPKVTDATDPRYCS